MRLNYQKMSYEQKHRVNKKEDSDAAAIEEYAKAFCVKCRVKHPESVSMIRRWSESSRSYFYICKRDTEQEKRIRDAQEALARIKKSR